MKVVKKIDKKVAEKIKKGAVAAYPTDTAYGLGASVNSSTGIKKIFKIKGRVENKPVSVAVSSLAQARQFAVFNRITLMLWKKFMPGALTIILPLSASAARKKNWQLLSAGSNSIGVRMPDNEIALRIIRMLEEPITTTSANVSGNPPAYSPDKVYDQFQDKKVKPDIIIDGGRLKRDKISTIVDCTKQDIKILRQGKITEKQITAVVNKTNN